MDLRKKNNIITLTLLILFIQSCGETVNKPTEKVLIQIDSIKIIEGNDNQMEFLKGEYLIAKKTKKSHQNKNYFVFENYLNVSASEVKSLNESIFYLENGDIIEDSSRFFSCTKIGRDLLISYCFYNKNDSAKLIFNCDFDERFVSRKPFQNIKFNGNSILIQDYKKFTKNDTFRAILAPVTGLKTDLNKNIYEMMFVEFPSRNDFSLIK